MNIFTVFKGSNVLLSCFRQLPPNLNTVLIPVEITKEARLLSVVVRVLITSFDNPLDFNDEIKVSLVAKLVILGILFSISVILAFKSVF